MDEAPHITLIDVSERVGKLALEALKERLALNKPKKGKKGKKKKKKWFQWLNLS